MNQQSQVAPVNPASGHSQAAIPAGTGFVGEVPAQFSIGALNGVGGRVESALQKTQAQSNQAAAPATPSAQEAHQVAEAQTAARQLTEKDERHFAKFVSQASQEKYEIGKLAVETDADAIYKIAETDKELAARLLKEYDFGTENVEELLEKRNVLTAANPEEAERQIQDAKWKKQMESELMDERILRLKGEDSEIVGEVESQLRDIYQDPAFSKFDLKQKVAMAKAISGGGNKNAGADDVALAILKREEGTASSPRTATKPENTKSYSPEFRAMQKAMGVSDKDLELLPDDIDQMISNSIGGNLPKF